MVVTRQTQYVDDVLLFQDLEQFIKSGRLFRDGFTPDQVTYRFPMIRAQVRGVPVCIDVGAGKITVDVGLKGLQSVLAQGLIRREIEQALTAFEV